MQASVTLPSDRAAPASARAWAEQVGCKLDNSILHDLRLIVTELVTNAVKYGPGEPIHLCLHVRPPRSVRGVVVDHGDDPRQIQLRSPSPMTPGGRGLQIVHRLADHWHVEEGSTQVWFELSRST